MKMKSTARRKVATHDSPLTERECQVLGLVAKDLTNREIAEQLGITTKGVEARIHKIGLRCELMPVKRTKLGRLALDMGI